MILSIRSHFLRTHNDSFSQEVSNDPHYQKLFEDQETLYKKTHPYQAAVLSFQLMWEVYAK